VVWAVGAGERVSARAAVEVRRRTGPTKREPGPDEAGSAVGADARAKPGVGREDAMVEYEGLVRSWDERREALKKLEWREEDADQGALVLKTIMEHEIIVVKGANQLRIRV
jgi:hypothetical protein